MRNCKHCGQNRIGSTSQNDSAVIQTAETTEVRSWTSLPLLDVSKVPSDLDLIGGSNSAYQSWRIPADYFLPGGALNNTQYKTYGVGLEIPNKQVLPVRSTYDTLGIGTVVEPALAVDGQTATDIVISYVPPETESDANGNVLKGTATIMKSGYYTFPRPHMYEIGKTYYLSQSIAGQVISVKPTAGIAQPLFSVVDETTISINVQLI